MPLKTRHGLFPTSQTFGGPGFSTWFDMSAFTSCIFYVSDVVDHVFRVEASLIGFSYILGPTIITPTPAGDHCIRVEAPIPGQIRLHCNSGTGNITLDAVEGVREIA